MHELIPGLDWKDVLAHQVVARDRDQVPFAHVPQAMQDGGHAPGHGGLARAWPAGEAHMQSRRLSREAHATTHPVHQQQGDGRRGAAGRPRPVGRGRPRAGLPESHDSMRRAVL